ncbi:hypothetical protein D3C81_953520 [compost metagenome]
MLRSRLVDALDDHRGSRIPKDEVAVAIAEVQVAGADLRVDHQHRTGLAELHGVARRLQAEGGGRTGHVHVVAEALDTQRRLHFDGNRRVGALQVGAGDDHAVDIRRGAAGTLQRFFRRGGGHLAKDAPVVVAALGNARSHALRIEDTGLVHHETALDAGSLLDEGRARLALRFQLVLGDCLGVLLVVLADVGIEGFHQLIVGDAEWRGIQTGSADHDFMHGQSSSQSIGSGLRAPARRGGRKYSCLCGHSPTQ